MQNQTKHIKLSELTKLPNNPRTIKDASFKSLVASIQANPDYFEARPIICSNRTGELIIIAGNQRYEAAKTLKLKDAPVYVMEGLTEEREREIIIRDNISNGEFDWDMLANEWDQEKLIEWGLELPADWGAKLETTEDDYEIPDEIKTDIVLGDLFEIGQHRLLCGDSTDSDQVAKLMNGQKADMVFTDPPYDFKGDFLKNCFDICDQHIFVMDGDKNHARNLSTYKEYFNVFYCVHFKVPTWNLSPLIPLTNHILIAEYQSKHSIHRKLKGLHSVIEVSTKNDRAESNYKAKNLKIIEPFILNFSDKKNIIVDLFGGSGSIMAASEQLGRKCYMMEFDEKNCQIILDRMKKCYNLVSNKLTNN